MSKYSRASEGQHRGSDPCPSPGVTWTENTTRVRVGTSGMRRLAGEVPGRFFTPLCLAMARRPGSSSSFSAETAICSLE